MMKPSSPTTKSMFLVRILVIANSDVLSFYKTSFGLVNEKSILEAKPLTQTRENSINRKRRKCIHDFIAQIYPGFLCCCTHAITSSNVAAGFLVYQTRLVYL